MKNFLLLSLALLGVAVMLYTGLKGLAHDHSYGLFFTFVGGVTTVGLGLDVVSQLKVQIKKNSIRKLGRL